MTDAQKAQAILNAALTDGGKVRGEYLKWLGTAQGRQFLLSQSIEQTKAALGKALQPAMVAIIPIIIKLTEWFRVLIREVQVLAVRLTLLPPILKAIGMTALFNFQGAAKAWGEYAQALEHVRESVERIRKEASGNADVAPFVLPMSGQDE